MAAFHVAVFLVLPVISTAYMIDGIKTSYQPYDQAWKEFKQKYGETYTGQENARRYDAFVARVKMIEAHNKRFENNQETYTMGITNFADDYENEVGSCLGTTGGRRKRWVDFCSSVQQTDKVSIPETVDWRQDGAVTPVRHQEDCGCCYAFASTTALSAQLQIQTGKLVELSEQQLVDCSVPDGEGCEGSFPHLCFEYINRTAGGIVPSKVYPYTSGTNGGQAGSCKFEKYRKDIAATVMGCKHGSGEDVLKYMVATLGPVDIAFAASWSFQSYKTNDINIFDTRDCPSDVNHAMTVVGYGSHRGKHYWIVKNSWGTDWGKDGYAYIQRGVNLCQIGYYLVVPDVQAVPGFNYKLYAIASAPVSAPASAWFLYILILLVSCLLAE